MQMGRTCFSEYMKPFWLQRVSPMFLTVYMLTPERVP